MYDERELTVEQIGQVLGVSRTSIYRALGTTTTSAPPAAPATATAGTAESPAATQETSMQGVSTQGTAGDAAVARQATQVHAPVDGTQLAVRSRGRSRWFVVQADPADPEHGPVAVRSGHTTFGQDMAFVGRQVRFDIDGDEPVLDLLLFSVEQLRYVVIELKIGRFDPAYVGQLGTYVAVVDDRLRRSDRHAPTVGILLCKGRNDTLVRYALAGEPAPLAVADYTYETLPPQERGGLPTAAELAAALERPVSPASSAGATNAEDTTDDVGP